MTLLKSIVTHQFEICEQRDTKGLYQNARAGVINDFTGISSPYEIPQAPELAVKTGTDSLEECTAQVIELLKERNILTIQV